MQEFLRCKAVVVIACLPELKIRNCFFALRPTAINEMLGDKTDFGHMEMRRQF